LTVISSIESQNDVPLIEAVDMMDLHFYRDPEWFFRNTMLFNRIRPRPGYKIYVGEYACNQGVGSGNLYGALSEAAFMTGMERNSDLVTLCSYAPLIENSNARNWPVNLIQVRSNQALGRSSYYVQRLFSENRPDANIGNSYHLRYTPLSGSFFNGRVGLATWQTHASYRNLKIMQHGKTLYLSDFNPATNGWTVLSGEWKANQGMYTQADLGDRRLSVLDIDLSEPYTIEVQAMKLRGTDGFNLICGLKSPEEYFIYNIGGWGNAQTAIERISPEGGSMQSEPVPFSVVPNRWYSLKLQVGTNTLKGFVDDSLIVDYTVSQVEKRYFASGYDRGKNEIVIKAVNAESEAWQTNIWIQNAGAINPDGQAITLSSESRTDENTFDEPGKVVPVAEVRRDFSDRFKMTFKPYSLTVLRIGIAR
jgi:alpha-N-arabinofuranosidase